MGDGITLPSCQSCVQEHQLQHTTATQPPSSPALRMKNRFITSHQHRFPSLHPSQRAQRDIVGPSPSLGKLPFEISPIKDLVAHLFKLLRKNRRQAQPDTLVLFSWIYLSWKLRTFADDPEALPQPGIILDPCAATNSSTAFHRRRASFPTQR